MEWSSKRILYCFDDVAFYVDNSYIDCKFINKNRIELYGHGCTKLYMFGRITKTIKCNVNDLLKIDI